MQCDRQGTKSKQASAFKQLMRGIVNGVFGIIETLPKNLTADDADFTDRFRARNRGVIESKIEHESGQSACERRRSIYRSPITLHGKPTLFALLRRGRRLPLQKLGW